MNLRLIPLLNGGLTDKKPLRSGCVYTLDVKAHFARPFAGAVSQAVGLCSHLHIGRLLWSCVAPRDA